MTTDILFDRLFEDFLKVNPNDKMLSLYEEIRRSYSWFEMEEKDFFAQLKKNAKGDGLALEIMFFNDEFLIDLVFSNASVETVSARISKIIDIGLDIVNGTTPNDTNNLKNVTLKIRYGSTVSLAYSTNIERFSQLNTIKNRLLKLAK